jgi:hypothetical protein
VAHVTKVDVDIDFIVVVCYKIARFPCEIIASQRMIAAAGGH